LRATPSKDLLVFEQPGNQWYEGPLTRVTISLDNGLSARTKPLM
jgi:hypothetical protein